MLKKKCFKHFIENYLSQKKREKNSKLTRILSAPMFLCGSIQESDIAQRQRTQNSPITKNDMQMQNDAVYISIMICIQFNSQQHILQHWPFSFCPILFIHISPKRMLCTQYQQLFFFFIRSTINEFANYPFE